MKEKIVISLDCFGGDFAPKSVIDGLFIFLKKNKKNTDKIEFLLFGDETKIKTELLRHKGFKNSHSIIHTDKKIDSDEKPSTALRKGKDSSMWLALESVKNKTSDACISAGNTGALMAMSKLILRPLGEIERPALIQLLPTNKGNSVAFLDLGANVECSSENLYNFAVMGSVFFEAMTGKENARIGLLNIGTEDIKGNEAIKNTATILKESILKDNFYGFVEGNDIFTEKVDVIVTDGFTGNIALKTIEGTAKFVVKNLIISIKKSIISMFGLIFLLPALIIFKKKVSPENYNGALFIGLNGISVKSHGNANGKSFYSAIKNTVKIIQGDINKKITEILKENLEV